MRTGIAGDGAELDPEAHPRRIGSRPIAAHGHGWPNAAPRSTSCATGSGVGCQTATNRSRRAAKKVLNAISFERLRSILPTRSAR